jgi:hypothetical protein
LKLLGNILFTQYILRGDSLGGPIHGSPRFSGEIPDPCELESINWVPYTMDRPVSETDPRGVKADSQAEMASIATIIIGRNEGERLSRCLASLPAGTKAVYVDSGSTDDSLASAAAAGVQSIALPREKGFTAARARNAGIRYWQEQDPDIGFVQMLDGDCEIRAGWLAAAAAALQVDPGLCAVFGRRRERFADATVYNRLCDIEWTIPPGPATAFGGRIAVAAIHCCIRPFGPIAGAVAAFVEDSRYSLLAAVFEE